MFAASKTASVSGGYQISRSLRFNSADSAYLNRTPASAGNRRTWTLSAWVKRSEISASGARNLYFVDGNSDSTYASLFFQTTNTFIFEAWTVNYFVSTAVYRDPSAWYHIVIAWDTTQATNTNRVKVYINGQDAAGSYNYPSQNADGPISNSVIQYLGRASTNTFNGYMTEVNFIDGQALTPSSFGETNSQTGVWQPKAYSGSYGTNGFYLNFSDNSNTTAATLGKDYSGNGNNWTPNNFSVTAGAGNDSLVDSPTSYGTDTGVGGTVRGNYATLNPLNATPSALISNGNLYALSNLSGHYTSAPATISVTSGKWYAEVVFTRVAGSTDSYYVGVADAAWQASQIDNGGWYGRWWRDGTGYAYGDTGNKITGTTSSSYGATYTQGDVIGIALDMDAGTLTFYKNGTSQGVAFTGITGTKTMAAGAYKDTGITLSFDINLGQRPFAYTAPSGFKALCTQNLPTPTIGATTATQANQYFTPVLYTGNGSNGNAITVGFQPDFTWLKGRSNAQNHGLFDAVRGAGKGLQSNSTGAEYNLTDTLNSFNANGFTVNNDSTFNGSGYTYVAWNWKANGSGSTNTSGTITSTVSANTTSGFSVVTYTGTGSAATIGHGLGVAPSMLIFKSRSNGSENWNVYHKSLGASTNILLNSTIAAFTDAAFLNATAPTSTVLSVGGSGSTGTNQSSGTYVCYAFAEVAGYSKFGSYTGNGSTNFIYTGFRPAYVLIRRTNVAAGWGILDSARNSINSANKSINANVSDAEGVGTAGSQYVDLLSNGFKCLDSSAGFNASGDTYIYMAFAEAPFKYSLAR